MKKVFLIVISIMLLTGCQSNSDVTSKELVIYEGDSANNVSMIIKEGTLTKTSATIIITDYNDNYEKDAYSLDYQLYKKQNGNWVQLSFIIDNVSTTLRNYFVNEEKKLEMEQNWEEIYGKLSKGEYKLVKHFTNSENEQSYTFSADFIIE